MTIDETNKILLPHLRQYRHNDGKSFVAGYDRAGIEQIFNILSNMAYEDGWNDAITQMTNQLDKMENQNE